jgi:release factor glutamine methyltransferase
MIVGEALAEGAALLREAGAESPSLDASLLLAAAVGIDRSRLLARRPDPLEEAALSRYRDLLARRASGDCVAYVLGHKEFRGLDFLVTPAVLVPRPDTETLVEAALEWIDGRTAREAGRNPQASGHPLRVLDVCTGSGCVAVSLKAERPSLDMAASDLSPAALAVTRSNAERLLVFHHRGTEDTEGRGRPQRNNGSEAASEVSPQNPNSPETRLALLPVSLPLSSSVPSSPSVSSVSNSTIKFYESDLLSSVPGRFDLIVSNPPYVPTDVIEGLSVEVRREPRLALDGGEDGLDLIRRLIAESRERLDSGGRLLVESGEEQTGHVAELMRGEGFLEIEIYRDLAGLGRVTGGSAPDAATAHGV